MFWSWKLKKQLINSGLAARKSGRSSLVELRFVLTVYKPCVLVFSISMLRIHELLTLYTSSPASPRRLRKEENPSWAHFTLFQPLWLSPEQPSRWCFVCDASMYGSIAWEYKSCAREWCGGAKCDTTSNELEMKKPVPTQSADVYIHTMKHIWAHSNPLACTLLTGSIRVKKTPQAI